MDNHSRFWAGGRREWLNTSRSGEDRSAPPAGWVEGLILLMKRMFRILGPDEKLFTQEHKSNREQQMANSK